MAHVNLSQSPLSVSDIRSQKGYFLSCYTLSVTARLTDWFSVSLNSSAVRAKSFYVEHHILVVCGSFNVQY